MTQDPSLVPGELIDGRYRIVRELGHGGMATVLLCVDIATSNSVAVKILRPELGNVVTKDRFFREIDFASHLDHPCIPRVLHSGTSGRLPYYAMNFVEGESLRQRLKRERSLEPDEVVRIATAIIEPMSYAHSRGIVHRDIKPENVLLHGDEVHVLDFGIARAIVGAAGERLTRTGITVGTPAYMSPEQVTADRALDLRSDIYSLGCVMYEMLAGAPPFRGGSAQLLMAARFTTPPKPLHTIRPEIPDLLEKAIARAMSKSVDDRWQSADEFAAAIRTVAASGTTAEVDGGLADKLRATFADSYRVEEEMKGAGMARLFHATDLALGRHVVIKILPRDLVSPMMLAQFERESEITASLHHPHILPVITAGVRDGFVYYIMPFIDGGSLRSRMERGQVPVAEGTRLLQEMTDALAYAHRQGIIHHDIRPENILLQDGHAIIAHFGIAPAQSGGGGDGVSGLTGTGMSLGPVGYMAPEQALGARNVDARADIYAVGVVGYELIAGEPPFAGATDQAILVAHLTRDATRVNEVRPDTPPAVAAAIHRAMQKDPASRFQHATEFRDALEASLIESAREKNVSFANRIRAIPGRWKIAVPTVLVAIVSIGQCSG